MKSKKTWFDRATDEFDRLPVPTKSIVMVAGLVLVGMIASNHTSMVDLINLVLVLKEFLKYREEMCRNRE